MDKVNPARDAFCPYVGLQPFNEADQDYFFGRERDSRIISSNLYAAPLTILYGASGVGKSSVLRAGVMPRLRHRRTRLLSSLMDGDKTSPRYAESQVSASHHCHHRRQRDSIGHESPA